MTDEEPNNDEASHQLFFNQIIPGLWVGLLDLLHDMWMRLGEFMEQQSQIYEEVMTVLKPEESGGAEVIPFPIPEEETNNNGNGN